MSSSVRTASSHLDIAAQTLEISFVWLVSACINGTSYQEAQTHIQHPINQINKCGLEDYDSFIQFPGPCWGATYYIYIHPLHSPVAVVRPHLCLWAQGHLSGGQAMSLHL